jgi:thiosulfate/3-mercaptopyruvate sulfurtransferase
MNTSDEAPGPAPTIAPFIDVAALDQLCETTTVVTADVRWYLDGRSGKQAYVAGHLPGAVFVDLDTVLANPPAPAAGRHPLPSVERFAEGLASAGISDGDTVVAYDDAGGVIAARLVWLLRAQGREAAVLDGGIAAWQRGHPGEQLEAGPSAGAGGDAGGVRRVSVTMRPWPDALLATIDETQAAAADGTAIVLDARTLDRYRGDAEPVDERAGHIPGALSFSCRDNVAADDTLVAIEALRGRLVELGAGDTPVISYCGSGVTACHTLLVLEHAGFWSGRLYPGSWSQYAADPLRPVAVGQEPPGREQ